MNDAEWEPMVDVNYVSNDKSIILEIFCSSVHRIYNQKGIVHGTILGLNHMGKHKDGKGGTIVNMSSIVGLQGNPIAPIYAGTQFAIVGFTSSLLVKNVIFINNKCSTSKFKIYFKSRFKPNYLNYYIVHCSYFMWDNWTFFSFAYFQTFYEKTGVRVLIICPGLTTTNLASKFMSSKAYAMDLLDDDIAAKEMTTMESQPYATDTILFFFFYKMKIIFVITETIIINFIKIKN